MRLSQFAQVVESLASSMDGDPEVILFDRATETELRVDPDADVFDYEILRGDREIVIEFGESR